MVMVVGGGDLVCVCWAVYDGRHLMIDTLLASSGLSKKSLFIQEHANITDATILGVVAAKKYLGLREAMKALNATGLAAKEATGKTCDQAAISGDNEAYAPEFNQLRADMMTIITMHKVH
ncbi:hypothetical protein Tco_1153397 [Tanacetum coccineum]